MRKHLSGGTGSLVGDPVEIPGSPLAELLAGITDANIHPELDFGSAVGLECLPILEPDGRRQG